MSQLELLRLGYNEETFWLTVMNPVAKGCSGNPEQSLIPETILELEIYCGCLVGTALGRGSDAV